MTLDKRLTCIEFYCGIGGMHYALKEIQPESEVRAAVDINPSALTIYAHNFPTTSILNNNIQSFQAEKLDKLNADLWTMSPPCQPFTKKGLQKGHEDERCESLKVLLDQLVLMERPPRFIFLENVVGFESSEMHEELLDRLWSKGYIFEEFILCPTQFGVPNRRPRYYLLCRRRRNNEPIRTERIKKEPPVPSLVPDPIGNFIEKINDEDESLRLPQKSCEKFRAALSVVSSQSRTSACFTKSYTHYLTGCGSFYDIQGDSTDCETNKIKETEIEGLKIRRLTPREVANLMCFPAEFQQPPNSSDKQMYKTLGNSVNVRVVSLLLKYLLSQ
ncbi:unnamed protein product [Caenorhabditis auriculariae]|uniref:tRNA (cytosine(38)-C(5))-methyltransferase n=1 Tax=Caenorhabditis auriculariae TaxID=2777116 RepID=A0A8S1HSK2_9PELO|nr:unnamed protein product [Caenorhabditis auriculariae]